MLRVTTIHANTAGPSARYYTRYLADEGVEGEGEWRGRQAVGLSLDGTVSTHELEALLSGHDPVTGARLGSPLVDRVGPKGNLIPAVAGFDATFSAPKSVSVWWALTGDKGLLDAHDLAVRAVLDYLERHGATTRVRVNGDRQYPETGGLVMAAFRQATSREDDPQLHTHVVISTKVRTADGRWMALDARYLKRRQRALGGLYQSVLRAQLSHRYGVAWEHIENGQAEIAGMPRELLDAFSKRTSQVDAALLERIEHFREREGRDPSRWERAALTREAARDTRAVKSHESTGDLREAWREEAAELGWTVPRVVDAMATGARMAPSPQGVTVGDVVERLSIGGSCWTRTDVLQAICDLMPAEPRLSGRAWADALDVMCDDVIGACVSLDPSDPPGPVRECDGRSVWLAPTEPHLTQRGILAQEQRILRFAADASNTPARPSSTVDRAGLDVLQADAAAAAAGDAPLVLIVGSAGAGKARTLRHAAIDLRDQNRPAFGIAPTAKAAKVLRDEASMPADTVAKLLHEWRRADPRQEFRLPAGTTLVLDEAGMVGTGSLDEVVKLAVSQRWRLVLTGDPRQLQAVGRGGMFDELCRIGPSHELATVHRFRHVWERAASVRLRAGDPDAIDAYIDHGRVASGSFEQLVADIARACVDQTAAGRQVAVVAETNAHVDALNAAIHREHRANGDLGDNVVGIAGGETAASGDVVVARRNDRTITTDRGEPVRNRDRWKILDVAQGGGLVVEHLDGNGQVSLPPDYVREHLRLGYAATTYGHQGDTVDVGYTIVTEATSHRGLYVGATRARDENHLLVVTDDPENARDILERALTNDRADIPAVAQRRNLARQMPTTNTTDDTVAGLRHRLAQAERHAEPHLRLVDDADDALRSARATLGDLERAHAAAPVWRRRRLAKELTRASQSYADAQSRLAAAEGAAGPFVRAIGTAEADVRRAEQTARTAALMNRLDHLQAPAADRGIDRSIGF